jgi:hypothetical protein
MAENEKNTSIPGLKDPMKAVYRITGQDIFDLVQGLNGAQAVVDVSKAYLEEESDMSDEVWNVCKALPLAAKEINGVISRLIDIEEGEAKDQAKKKGTQ